MMENKNNEFPAPEWINLTLSELIEKSLKHGMVPMFTFLDKDKVKAESRPAARQIKSSSIMEETPAIVLEKQIAFYESFIARVESREGVEVSGEDGEKKLQELVNELKLKIVHFRKVVKVLTMDLMEGDWQNELSSLLGKYNKAEVGDEGVKAYHDIFDLVALVIKKAIVFGK